MAHSGQSSKKSSNKEWLVLVLIILALLPVTIDATILHVAIPTLTLSLGASGTEVLWIIDIYPLVMAGLLLPMGVLGDKVGHKKIISYGLALFAIGSLLAGFSATPLYLIFSRGLLAFGGSMIMPGTLAIIRQTFTDEGRRGTALGIWAAAGTAGAAVGPVIGGIIVEHFWWGAVFLVNIPLLLLVIPLIGIGVPKSISDPTKPWILKEAVVVLAGVILFIYSIKSFFKANSSIGISSAAAVLGIVFLFYFFRKQKTAALPMIDISLLQDRRILIGMLLCFIPMAVIVGFEFLLAQELQFVHLLSPINAGLFMLPFVIASAVAGPITGSIIQKAGFRNVIVTALTMAAVSFFVLSTLEFSTFSIPLLIWFILLGFSLGMILITATTSIMAAAPENKAGMAGSMESIAYELGTGLGITFFGIVLSQLFIKNFAIAGTPLPSYPTISDAIIAANTIGGPQAELIKSTARMAFQEAHHTVLLLAGSLLLVLALLLLFIIPKAAKKVDPAL